MINRMYSHASVSHEGEAEDVEVSGNTLRVRGVSKLGKV